MSKTSEVTKIDLEKEIMTKVQSDEIRIKPKWYFVLGSALTLSGFVGLTMGAVFLTNLTFFLLRRHGPGARWRVQIMLDSFPLWIPILAAAGIISGIWLMRKYDFSYKKNFLLIVLGFIVSIIVAAFILDSSGLNDFWSRRGWMRRFYQQIDEQKLIFPGRQGWERGRRL